jgi:dolichol kinase
MLNGASWVMIDSVLIILIFPPLIASMALSILIVCDVFAAVIGRKFGKHKIFDKSIEGTVAFNLSGILLLTAYMTVYDLSWIFFIFGVIAVFAASMVELFAKEYNVDDNIAIPFTAGTILWVASSLLHSHGSGFAYIV